MSQALAVRAEIVKLARLLRRDPATLDYLEQVPADDVRLLREQVTDVLFTAHGQILERLAAASKLLPIRVVAAIGQRAFGPVLAARITGLLDPSRAVEMAETMPTEFLTDLAVELDPRRASAVIGQMPPVRVAEITRELVRRREYVPMGRFVGHLSDGALRAAVEVMDDGDLLQVAFVLEAKETLDGLVGLLPPARLDGVIEVAAREALWVEVVDLLSHLSAERRAVVAVKAGEFEDAALHSLIAATAEHAMWPELLPLLPILPRDSQLRVARELARLDVARRDVVQQQMEATGMTQQISLLRQELEEQG